MSAATFFSFDEPVAFDGEVDGQDGEKDLADEECGGGREGPTGGGVVDGFFRNVFGDLDDSEGRFGFVPEDRVFVDSEILKLARILVAVVGDRVVFETEVASVGGFAFVVALVEAIDEWGVDDFSL